MFRIIRRIYDQKNSYCVNSYLTIQLKEFLMCGIVNQTRYFNEEGDKQKQSKKKIKHHASDIPGDMIAYFKFNENLHPISSALPKKILKILKRKPEALYVIDPEVASTIANHVKQNIKRNSFVLELNPGIGLLSKELCSSGIENLRLYESMDDFSEHLKKVKESCSDKLELKFSDLFSLWKISYQDRMDGGCRVDELLEGIPRKEWTDDPALTIVGVLPTMLFINSLIYSLILQHGIMLYGRPELYLVMNELFYTQLTCLGTDSYKYYKTTSVLFQVFFTLKLLQKLPRKAFLPWEKKKSKSKMSNDIMYLVKIEARRDLFEKVLPVELLQHFWYFVKHHLTSRKNRVIPCLERWIPGCGVRLLLRGMPIYKEFGELTPQEVLELFRDFSSWPEYMVCPFIPSMETALLKFDQPDIDKDTEKKINKKNTQSSSSDSDIEENLEQDDDHTDKEDKHSAVH